MACVEKHVPYNAATYNLHFYLYLIFFRKFLEKAKCKNTFKGQNHGKSNHKVRVTQGFFYFSAFLLFQKLSII